MNDPTWMIEMDFTDVNPDGTYSTPRFPAAIHWRKGLKIVGTDLAGTERVMEVVKVGAMSIVLKKTSQG